MPFTKFLGIVLGCYAVYYFFIVLIDLIKSKTPAVAADRKSLHSVQYDLAERPNIKSERVSKDTHGSASSTPAETNNNSTGEPTTHHQQDISENKTEEKKEPDNKESLSDDNSPLGQYDLEEERKTVRAFNLEHEEVSEGIEVSEENFNRLVSFV